MKWNVRFHPDFEDEFDELPVAVRRKLYGYAKLLEEVGPLLGRPWVDTLNGSRYVNMKELRFTADGGVWRVAFALTLSGEQCYSPPVTSLVPKKVNFTNG